MKFLEQLLIDLQSNCPVLFGGCPDCGELVSYHSFVKMASVSVEEWECEHCGYKWREDGRER